MRARASITLALLVLLAPAGMAFPARAADEPQASPGRVIYRQYCSGCHLEKGFGTRILAQRVPAGQAMLENREKLGGAYVRAVVRRGMRLMPQFRKSELSDQDLGAIADYLEKRQ